SSPMSISNMVSTPDGTVHVRGSPQRNKVFSGFFQIARTSEAPGDLEVPESKVQAANSLIFDVKTCWNSTYMTLNRAYNLLKQMIEFLQPLNKATKFLCKSAYPTLNTTIPMYIGLMKEIISVKKKIDASQLLAPADEMVKKLKKYLIPALKKPGPICAMILDPRIKTTHFENNWQFLLDKLKFHMTPDACSKIEQSIFAPRVATRTLASEIQHREKTFPFLANLAIPETSAANKWVFSKSKAIIGLQRAGLDSTSIEQ
ncbi:uncharacterized protein VP01_7070g1, partial [Puccinia sorghi]